MRPRFWHRIRFRLLLVSLTLLGIPWAGYRFIQETEQFLRDAQDQALQTTAGSVANIMHGLDGVFHGTARPGSVLTFRNLYLHRLDKAPQVDGYRDEWERLAHNFTVLQSIDASLEARLYLGQHDRHVYLLIGVRDPEVRFGPSGDAVDLALVDKKGRLRRYRIQPEAPGWVTAEPLATDDNDDARENNRGAFRGEWQNTEDGYTLELRLPRAQLGDRLSVRLFDSGSRQVLASGLMYPAQRLGRIIEPSTVATERLQAVAPPATRVWVTDHQGLVLARAGQLDSDAPLSADQSAMPWFVRDLILAVLPGDADAVAGLPADQSQLFFPPVVNALAGRPATLRRQPPRGDAVVVSAAVPIRGPAGIEGAVLVEQTTNAILSIQNLALQRLFGVTLILFAATSLVLLAFASLLATRITHLRDRVEAAVAPDGRIVGQLEPEHGRDEIGDLGRSFVSVLDRLRHYNRYLEAMASRLAHELRTPLAVVRSSLDNADQAGASERDLYLQRARDGITRLDKILNRLREATGLEQAMRQAERCAFDLGALLRQQTEAFRTLHPGIPFELTCPESVPVASGVPDLVSDALDKVISNAVDFRAPDTSIQIRCSTATDHYAITVFNQGRPLPDDADVFQSMVSSRRGQQHEPHLGLGLYLVRLIAEFHGGGASACNRDVPPGVEIQITLGR